MYEDEVNIPDGELARLSRGRRQVYMTGMLLVVGVLVCAWIVRSPTDAYRAFSAPIFALVVLALVVSLWRGRMELARVEMLMLLVLSAMPLSRQVWLFYAVGPPGEEWLRLLGNSYWATSGVLVVVCTIGDRRQGLIAGVGIVLASVLIALIGIGIGLVAGDMPRNVLVYVIGSLLFLSIFLVLMRGATIMRDQWQSALSRAEAYSRLALTDMLTGLGNRRAASGMLARLCANARRHGEGFAVILGDLDAFKQINDSAGHAVGDAVLVEVAKRLRATVRDADAVMRWGGEEFLILAPKAHLDGAQQLAERCRSAMEAEPFAGVIRITMTFGVAEFMPGDSDESVLARADANLYAGKRTSRNRVEARANPTVKHGRSTNPGG